MKRIWPFLLVLLLLAAPAAVQAQFTFTTNNGTITITGYTGPGGAMTIPSTINGLPVASIATNAFDDFTNLTSVTIPNSVTSIGENAFEGCISLTTVTIPASVTNIGEDAFFESGLTGVTFANGVTSIGDYAFNGCSSLTNITFPNSVTSIGAYAFWQAYALISVTIPASVTNVGNDIFGACYSLTNIAVDTGNPVYSSLNGVLFGQSQTTLIQYPGGIRGSYTIPASVRNIGVLAFERASLASVTIPGSVISIGEEAFYDSGLASVTIANGVTIIGDYAFAYCALTSVTIPASITSIGSQAFRYCRSLTNVCFEGNAPVDGGDIFENAPVATIYYVNGATGWGSTYDGLPTASCQQCGAGSLQVTITPAGAITAGAQWQVDGGTWENSGATVANLSVGNHTVSFSAVSGWTTPSNQTVSVSANSTAAATGVYTIIGAGETQFTFTTNSGTITITGYTGPGGALTIPSTINGYPVTTIGEEAFENCSTVTNVTIGTNVTSIGDYAFAYCALTSVTMPNSVTSIGDYAFYVCTRLTSAPIPASVTSIGYGVFEECFDMAAISVAANNPAYISVAGVLFNKSQTTLIEYPAGNAATSYMIPASVISIGYGAFSDIFVPNVTIPSSVTDIANQAFFGSGLTSVTIPQSVTNIGSTAFGDCGAMTAFSVDTSNPSYVALDGVLFNKSQTTLIEYPAAKVGTSFTIPSSVTSIGVWAFADCGLTSVTIPNSVTSIGDYAFAYSSLASVTIPNSITTIGYFAFTYSSSLANVTIPDTVTSIGDYAFAYCALTSVTMPNSVTSIGEYAFAYSTSLTSVYFEGNAPTAASTVFANESNVTVYYLSGTTGWSSTFAGVPTVELAGIVAFSANPTNGGVPLTVSFTSAAVDSGGNAITNWNWNFGDGSTSTAQNPSHTYTAVGTFSPALIATNSAAATIFGVGPPSITVTTATSNGFTVVYSYDSPTFSGVTPGSGLTSTNFVSASVTYSNVLAPNLQDASPNRSLQPDLPTSWVFSDGVEQWTPANSHFYVAQVNTDANGNIIGWNFNLYSNPGFSEPEVYISSSTPTSYGSVEVDLPLSGPYQTAYVEYGPGVDIAWRRTVAPAPTGVPITAAPTNGLAPLTVNFSAASVDSAGNAITRWNWTFGDGSTSTNQNPSHTYTAVGATVGAFYPTLVATNNIGGVVIGYGPSLITASNLLVAFSANPTNGRVPLTVSFTSAAVDSAGNAITNWNWSFGDGSTGTAQNPSHTYTAGGTFSPALIATNNIGEMVTGVGLAAITAISDTILHSFTNGVDGAYPVSGLLLSGNTLYGTAGGGRAGNGTVFAIKTDGTGFTNLYSFSSTGTNGLNSDGANPSGNLILSGNTLYGTANGGGSGGSGTVFAIKTDGTGFTKLYSFTALDPTFSTNSDGAYPVAGLLLSGNTLYGTAGNGGSEGSGTVFAVTTNGTGFTNLHSFTAVDATFFTNSDGVFPFSELISSGNILYGTANRGGIGGSGTVFAIKTDGTGFTNLYSFTALDATFFTNSDGAYPYSELISSGNTLYGTANGGGSGGSGTVFAIKTDGTGFTKLYSFTALDPTFSTNRDGANPQAGLILSGNTLYGTAESGGTWDLGTVFAVKTDGEGFTNLCSFTGASDGAYPCGTLVLSGNTLYGTTENGGSSGNGTVLSGNGTVFSLILPVGSLVPAQPGITGVSLSGANLVLNGINGQSGGTYYALMSTNLALPLSQWTPVATNVLSAGGNFTITATNTVTRGVPQRFYILQEQ